MTPKELVDTASHDHTEMASIVRLLRAALDAGDHDLMQSLLRELLMVEVRHYATEEALMRAVAYDEADTHRRQHAEMVDTLKRIVQTLVVENLASVSPQIVAHFETALAHMIDADQRLNNFVSASAD
jgi:hemerythrin